MPEKADIYVVAPLRRRALWVLVAVLAAAGGPAWARPVSSPHPLGGPIKTVRVLATGVTLTRIADPNGPYQIRVLTIDPARAVMIDTARASTVWGSVAKTSLIGQAHHAIAAVNGDFGVWPARPIHTFAHDGWMIGTGTPDISFAVSRDEQQAFTARVNPRVRATDESGGPSFAVAAWNTGTPSGDAIDGYTAVGGRVAPPPSEGCFVRLTPIGRLQLSPQREGATHDYLVAGPASCGASPGPPGTALVLASRRSSHVASATLHALRQGDHVSVTWSLGWPDVGSSVGGQPLLVSDGRALPDPNCHDYFCDPNPRTGIGFTATGRILLVTVDGRQRGWSAGMTLYRFAREMISLGAVRAMNLDGGGSTTMWARGLGVVNRPSDWGGERPISNAVVVLPESLFKEIGGIHRGTAPPPAPGGEAIWQTVLADPGSTGGLMHALADGSLGPHGPLPLRDLRIARAFAASR